jgi:hypothetical protein
MVEHMCGMTEALGSIPSTQIFLKREKKNKTEFGDGWQTDHCSLLIVHS